MNFSSMSLFPQCVIVLFVDYLDLCHCLHGYMWIGTLFFALEFGGKSLEKYGNLGSKLEA